MFYETKQKQNRHISFEPFLFYLNKSLFIPFRAVYYFIIIIKPLFHHQNKDVEFEV